jgi:hypothetical protein
MKHLPCLLSAFRLAALPAVLTLARTWWTGCWRDDSASRRSGERGSTVRGTLPCS